MEIISGKYTIKQIFKDHWESFLAKHKEHIPEYVISNVQKMLSCRDPQRLGYAKYSCPEHTSEFTIIPHSCKSRFCNACGVFKTNRWIETASGLFPNTTYYHITLTIPDYLWYFLKSNRHLLGLLFKASNQAVIGWFKQRGILPAMCSVLHTFGKDLKFNPHIHMIVSAGGLSYDKNSQPFWQSISFLPFKTMLRVRFRAILLTYLKPFIESDFKELLFSLNWYVHVNFARLNLSGMCRYIGRYTKRPAIAESRIIGYDGNFVSFFYEERNQSIPVFSKLPVEEFILRLIQHIPLKHFRMIRYYGLLANTLRKRYQDIILKLLGRIKKISSYLSWRFRQIKLKGFDPLVCRICGREMVLTELAFFSRALGGLSFRFF